MHPLVEGPGLAMHKPMRDLAAALIAAGEAAWYAAIHAAGVPVAALIAVGPEAEALAGFVDVRRRSADSPEAPMLYDKDGRLVEPGPTGGDVLLAWLGKLRSNMHHASDAVVDAPNMTPKQKLDALDNAQALDLSLAMIEDFVRALHGGDYATVERYIRSAANANAAKKGTPGGTST